MTPNIIILYTNIVKRSNPEESPASYYEAPTRRFFETYREFKPVISHRLGVVNCGVHEGDFFNAYPADEQYFYTGTGWDVGTYQAISKTLDCDLVVCFNSFVHFWRANWLEPIAEAYSKYGAGVYGFSGSFENSPHLRTCAICFNPEVIRKYPHLIDSRRKSLDFESFDRNLNFSLWALENQFPVLLVTASEVCQIQQWRTPPNIFRRGDQSNVLVWDRHTEIYAKASDEEKRILEQSADGPTN